MAETPADWPEGPLAAHFEAELEALLQRYRARPDHARAVLLEVLGRDPAVRSELQRAGQRGTPLDRIPRTKAWKSAVSRARKRVYAELRRYVDQEVDLSSLAAELTAAADPVAVETARRRILQSHVSTRERLTGAPAFFASLAEELAPARRILDLGCGVQPLLFPFEEAPRLERYTALDRDPGCVEAVAAWSGHLPFGGLEARTWTLDQGCSHLAADAGVEAFDLALLFKLLPVLVRQERDHLHHLAQLPARRWIVTGSSRALARHEDIGRRERRVITRLLADLGREVVRSWEVADELVFVVE